MVSPQKTLDVDPILVKYRSNVRNASPALAQRLVLLSMWPVLGRYDICLLLVKKT